MEGEGGGEQITEKCKISHEIDDPWAAGSAADIKKCSMRVPEEPPKSALMYALVLVLIHKHPSINLLKCLSINSDYADSRGRGEKTEFSFYMDGGEGGGGGQGSLTEAN